MKVTLLFTRKDPVNDDTVILDQSLELIIEDELMDAVALGYKVQAALVRVQRNWIMDEYGQLTEVPEDQSGPRQDSIRSLYEADDALDASYQPPTHQGKPIE